MYRQRPARSRRFRSPVCGGGCGSRLAFPPNTANWPCGGGNYSHINSLNTRGPEVSPCKRGETRILPLGSSSIFEDWVSL